jgi:integrase
VSKRTFGNVRRLPSGRHQARYTGPDGVTYTARDAGGRALTFDSRTYADAFLSRVHGEIQAGRWSKPGVAREQRLTLAAYAATWLATRVRTDGQPLSPGTRLLYRLTLNNQILPALGGHGLNEVTPAMVRSWYAGLRTGPRQRAAAYSLLRTIMNTALADDVIASNPCRVRGAGSSKRVRRIEAASLAELEAIVTAMPPRYRLMVLLAAWCALRFGELAELRRADVDVKNGLVLVRRGVVRGDDGRVVKDPKSDAGKRAVNIPPHLMPLVHGHLIEHTGRGRDALLFPSAQDPARQMSPSSLYAVYHPAREAAGRPDLRFHDLRHTGAVLAAATGATLAELMARLGHSTVAAAMRYQHAAADRDKVIAAALSELAAGTVTPIGAAKGKPARRKRQAAV